MSIAGIRSNRGDLYQTLVAFEWALRVLFDPNYFWLEIDSITCLVDDVVVGRSDGTQICFQCKKNHPDYKAWTIADLGDELDKAFRLLLSDPKSEVRFCSRNNFGPLGKLKEYASTQQDNASFESSLSKENDVVNLALASRLAIAAPGLSVFDFLRRTTFETTPEIDAMTALLRERLQIMVSNPGPVFDAIWSRLDQLGARTGGSGPATAVQYRLTKEDLNRIVVGAGGMLTPPMNLSEIREAFSSTSAIGRSWRRDIAGRSIPRTTLNDLLVAIEAKHRSILLIGLPGSGKTCLMLSLQEALEKRMKTRSDIVGLFVQSREFANLATAKDREDQGLVERWVEKAARLSEASHVVVLIDSLDVLSIARDHSVLTYFLSQIDRLLLISNITVVTACREFDRRYDRRIAERKWDSEFECQPLDWILEIEPLLLELGISTSNIDANTRELVRNPRELALFVELAQQAGSFNVVTSQALAQRYLDKIVFENNSLGDVAVKAIEALAAEMLKTRSLVVPYQRFIASQEVQRELCSLNVLQESQDRKLTFGHQTLLDVLVISGAARCGVTLNQFIQTLPAVPFVRPTIRNFVAQLAQGEGAEFRRQVRAVLTGGTAFHIRRLVAESYAEHLPEDQDWPLIRDLRQNYRDVFLVIYSMGRKIEWHRFWLRHLVPSLKSMHDREGLLAHAHRISQWSNEDTEGVVAFWMEVFAFDWMGGDMIADRLAIHLSEIKTENIKPVVPLLKCLLQKPQSDHSFLGRVIARCLAVDAVDDQILWDYIVNGVSDEDLEEYRFDKKLRCPVHEFGDREENFLAQRMQRSPRLLDLAVATIERWSSARAVTYGGNLRKYRDGFLNDTSWSDTHSKNAISHVESLNILMHAVEAAILHHATVNSDWWRSNCERLCFNQEGALLYFGIAACTVSPLSNIDLISRMLCDKEMLKFDVSYELGTLMYASFPLLNAATQDSVIATILHLWGELEADEEHRNWIEKARAELVLAIPCYLRSSEAQALLDSFESKAGTLTRTPSIRMYSGGVSSPIASDRFLEFSDQGVLKLLEHYRGHSDRLRGGGIDFLEGGESEVGHQLMDAASRSPSRFLTLLSVYWAAIGEKFRDEIMAGVATNLAYRFGNLQKSTGWVSIEEPDPENLVSGIIDALEQNREYWHHRRTAAKAVEACANVVKDLHTAHRLTLLALDFEDLVEADPIRGDNVSLISQGINMAKGDAVDALMILACNLHKPDSDLPELLTSALRRVALTKHAAIRALILRRLPYLQSKMFNFGWELFALTMQDAIGLWQIAEPCLYYSYRKHFGVVRPLLARLHSEGAGKDLETWGRISALAAMTHHLDFAELLANLATMDSADAYRGAAAVWTNSENIHSHRSHCLAGIAAGLDARPNHAEIFATEMERVFRGKGNLIAIPLDLISRCFATLAATGDRNRHNLFGFQEWLNATSQLDPGHAMAATEIYVSFVRDTKPHLYDYGSNITQLMTRLFAEAEEREESDAGDMLMRVVQVQDSLLALGLNGVDDWLKAAERPG